MPEIQKTTDVTPAPTTQEIQIAPLFPPRKEVKYDLVSGGANYNRYRSIVTDKTIPQSNFVSGIFTAGERVCVDKWGTWNNCTDTTWSISAGTAVASFGEKNVVSLYGEKTFWLADIFGLTGGGVFEVEQAIEGEQKRWAWRAAARIGAGLKFPLYKGSENNFDLAFGGGMNFFGVDGADGMIDWISAFDGGARVIWYWPQ